MSARPLHILFTPSLREGAWVDAIREAAAAKGLSVAFWGEAEADILVAHQMSIEKVEQVDPAEWVIMGDAPEAALISYGDAFREYPAGRQAWGAASTRLATAAWLAERGAPVLGQTAMAVSLPKLGLVSHRPPAIPDHDPGPFVPALSLFAGLPMRDGAKSVLPPQAFTYPAFGKSKGGPSRIDLTGRDRLLVDGPYMLLPPGLWRATLKLAIDPQGREVPLAFDWGEAHDMVSADAVVTQPGQYEIALERRFNWAGTSLMRVSLTQPLFQGVLEVLECVIERATEPKARTLRTA